MATSLAPDGAGLRARIGAARARVEGSLVWQVWDRMLEIEFVDRSVALAGKAFVSFFPLVIVVAAFVPSSVRAAIVTTVAARLGLDRDGLTTFRDAFSSSEDIRRATGILGLVFTAFFATSFTTALQRVYLRAWRRPRVARAAGFWRGVTWLLAMFGTMALLGFARGALDGPAGVGLFAALSLVTTAALWWFSSWLLLLGEVRPRVLLPTAVITSVAMATFAISATIWMPWVVSSNEAQFGFFGTALSLVTWFSGISICVVVGACAGPALAEDPGRVGTLVRGRDESSLTTGARPSLSAPVGELRLRDAFHSSDDG